MPEPPPDSGSNRTLEMAHVLFTDIVAYSRLPMDQQEQALHHLQEAVRETKEFTRAQASDQLIRLPTGDGMALVFLGDVEAPVRCALELHGILRRWPEMQLRMGIHTGPVYRVEDINAARNVSGGGINIAQRVMDCGDAGHILISKTVADVLDQVSTWNTALHDLGEAEVKHGVRVHLYNLYTDKAGNRELPQKLRTAQAAKATASSRARKKNLSLGVVVTGLIAGLVVGGFIYYRHLRQMSRLTDKDTIVLADFTNSTGDATFDVTLKMALSISLNQSPFLNLLPDGKVTATLKMMGRAPGDRLAPAVAHEICVRTHSKAMLAGSISSLGSQYVIGLRAVNCSSGDALAQEQVQAAAKEEVLKALDKAATSLRAQLGEALATVQKYDSPLEQATTPSLEALQAYSEGIKISSGDDTAALPLFKRSIELDPNFAVAYSALGLSYINLGQDGLANKNIQKAYELRERVSSLEKYKISSDYFSIVTGELEKAIQVYEQWAQAYPRSAGPRGNLAYHHYLLGQYEKALAENIECIRLNPDSAQAYGNLMAVYLALNRLEETKVTYNRALARKLDHMYLHVNRYFVAFLEGDVAEMQRQVAWAMGDPGAEDRMLGARSDSEAYAGYLEKARESSRQAARLAKRKDQNETGAELLLFAALREAEVGNPAQAREQVTQALTLSSTRDLQILAALTLARAGENARAQTIADDLHQRSPLNTQLNGYWLPTIRASIELNRKDPGKAVELLQATSAYELGWSSPLATLYPAYVRGEAYLRAGQGQQATGEFQKVIDHRGIVSNFVLGALAHLQLGRAKVTSGDQVGACKAYGDFFAVWKDADPDIPILKEAKAEYAKLQAQ